MKLKYIFYVAIGILPLASCNDFLDKVPDNRVDPTTSDQLLNMLVDGYPYGNYARLCEYSSDNIIDNNSPDKNGVRYNLQAYELMDDEIYAWEDVTASTDADSPSAVWESSYHAIAVANHVLAKIDELKKNGRVFEGTDLEKLNAAYGEALLIRAYNHFVLVNIFAQQYRGKELSQSILGIPYVTEPETEVLVQYSRNSVAEVYEKIEADLLEGLKYVSDTYYETPKYHFNKRAANAFAARFFLFTRQYERVEQYATAVLGDVATTSQTRSSSYWAVDFSNTDANMYAYVSSQSASNIMLLATQSTYWRSILTGRYAVNREPSIESIAGSGPTWDYSFHPCFNGKLYVPGGNQDYGVWFMKVNEFFEYTDKVAGIGYPHFIKAEFTYEETLLTRAEARIYLGNIDGAVADLKVWDDARKNLKGNYTFETLTKELIESYYDPSITTSMWEYDPRPGIFDKLNIDEICPSAQYSLTDDKLPYIYCVLHFRRIETIFDGFRWFDIKRYGIEFTRKIGRDREETLTKLDPRRALQLPAEVIAAGIEGNNRVVSSGSVGSSVNSQRLIKSQKCIPYSRSYKKSNN